MTLFIFTGCGIYDRTKIYFECIDNRVYATVYSANLVSADENIRKPQFLKRSNELLIMDDGSTVKCEK